MGGLRPIGSEKLQGMDKIRRIMEIATYNEVLPNSINENHSVEYSLPLADGNTYAIVKEKLGYIIKFNLNESTTEYIEPMQNRKYYPSYSQALKKMNLMAKEYNSLHGNDEGTSLFTEQKKKFVLKSRNKNVSTTPEDTSGVEPPEIANAPAASTPPPPSPSPDMGAETGGTLPPPPDMGSEAGGTLPPPPDMGAEDGGTLPPPPDMGGEPTGGEMEEPAGDEMGGEPTGGGMEEPTGGEMEEPEDMGDEEGGKKETGTTFKIIQKLTGKLAQKIRKYNDKDEMDGNDVKYIINSILSALDVDVLDDDDLEEIISRLEGDYEEGEDEDMEDEDMEDEEMPEEPTGDEEMPEPSSDEGGIGAPPPPEGGEMSEYGYKEIGETMNLGDAITKSITSKYSDTMFDKMKGMDNFKEEEEYPRHGARKKHSYNHLEHGTFGESKVDNIISKYFNITENEIEQNRDKRNAKKTQLIEERKRIVNDIKRLSENIVQERAALKLLELNPNVILRGLTNKGNLIFKDGINERKVTLNGKVL